MQVSKRDFPRFGDVAVPNQPRPNGLLALFDPSDQHEPSRDEHRRKVGKLAVGNDASRRPVAAQIGENHSLDIGRRLFEGERARHVEEETTPLRSRRNR